jgi:hypothetical protein
MDHLPEISGCGLHGTLSYYECSLLLVTLYIEIQHFSYYAPIPTPVLDFTLTKTA